MTCAEALTLLSEQLDTQLFPAQRDELEEHLTGCPACRRMQQTFALIRPALREDLVEPPAALKDGVMERIRAETSEPDTPKPKPIRRWRQLASLAACLALIVLGGVGAMRSGLFHPGGSSDSATLDTAQSYAAEEASAWDSAADDAPASVPEEETALVPEAEEVLFVDEAAAEFLPEDEIPSEAALAEEPLLTAAAPLPEEADMAAGAAVDSAPAEEPAAAEAALPAGTVRLNGTDYISAGVSAAEEPSAPDGRTLLDGQEVPYAFTEEGLAIRTDGGWTLFVPVS